MDKRLREKQGLKLLAQHPGTKVLWVCADGTAFDSKPLAVGYAAKIGNADILEVKAAAKPEKPAKKPSKKAVKTE